ncbi:MAG TPA: hypothetical protein VGM39_05960 [Kofleriaceae bacterium]|jgi:hypothetical protein
MKTLGLVAVLVCVGCGSSDSKLDGTLVVKDLSNGQQKSMCEKFLDDMCPTQLGTGFCTPCVMDACGDATSTGLIEEKCDNGVTVQDVDDCGTSGDNTTCVNEGGGCMFEALQAACPQ